MHQRVSEAYENHLHRRMLLLMLCFFQFYANFIFISRHFIIYIVELVHCGVDGVNKFYGNFFSNKAQNKQKILIINFIWIFCELRPICLFNLSRARRAFTVISLYAPGLFFLKPSVQWVEYSVIILFFRLGLEVAKSRGSASWIPVNWVFLNWATSKMFYSIIFDIKFLVNNCSYRGKIPTSDKFDCTSIYEYNIFTLGRMVAHLQ